MPPKKKKGGKKGKKGKKSDKDPHVLEIEERFSRTTKEVFALKEQMNQRKDLTRKAAAERSESDLRSENAQANLVKFKEDANEINAYMSLQYKTMQTQMGLQISQLETELDGSQKELEETQLQLKNTQEEMARKCSEKDATIQDLELKIESLHAAYQTVMENKLDDLTEKLRNEWLLWENRATQMHARYKSTLLEFDISPLEF